MTRISEQLMREELPYGMYVYANGARELFNRRYEVVRRSNGPGPEGLPVDRLYYFDDSNPPWRNAKTKLRCETVLRKWDRG